MQDQAKNDKKWAARISLISLLIFVMIIVFLLFKTEETYTSGDDVDEKIGLVSCVAKMPQNPFFVSSQSGEVEHSLKATFKNDKLDKLFYDFDGVYNSAKAAEYVEADLHSSYNIYMGKNNLSISMLDPTFAAADNKVKITLFTDAKSLIDKIITFFFLNMDEFQTIRSYSVKELVELYEGKGFSCTSSQ